MKKWNADLLKEAGYKIENAKIESVDLSMADHGVFCLEMHLAGDGWGVVYGGFVIGKGYLGAEEFSGTPQGIEYIMRIMDTVGVTRFNDMVGKYIRVATKGWGDIIKIIGNVIEDKWFDTETFFKDHKRIE